MRTYVLLGISCTALVSTGCQKQNKVEVPVVNETYVHRYGVEVPGDFWDASGQHGQVMSSMADGVVISRTYNSGLLDGDTTYSYPHSTQVQKRETYIQGSVVKETQYFFDGTPCKEIIYDCPLGMSTVSTWYLNGTPKSVEQINGQRVINGDYYTATNQKDSSVENGNGTRLIRDDYGQLISTDTIKEGDLNNRVTYYPNGSPRESTNYANGVIHGERKTYYPAGEPNTVEEWSNGSQHGTSLLYQHGEKYAEVPYFNGQKHGIEVRYRDGQQVVQEISWNQGRMHGPATTYVGNTSNTEWFYGGSPVTEGDYYIMKNRAIVR